MATNSFTVGTGGDYSTLALWYAARRTQVAAGDIEEAVMLDGTHDWGAYMGNWNAVAFTCRIRGQSAQDGDWTTGAKFANHSAWFQFFNRSQDTVLEFEDLVIESPTVNRPLQIAGGSTSIARDFTLNFKRCMIYLQTMLVQYAEDQPGRFLLNFTNCIAESDSDNSTSQVLNVNYSATRKSDVYLTAKNCTFAGVKFQMQGEPSNTVANASADIRACLIDNTGGNIANNGALVGYGTGNYARGGSSVDCITTETSANHAIWANNSVTNATYEASFNYDGTTAAGEVSFTGSGSATRQVNEDFSLVDDADNLALAYAENATGLPSLDIIATTRNTVPDAGAFEVYTAPPQEEEHAPAPDPNMTTKVSTGMLKEVATSTTNDGTSLDTANAGKVVQLNAQGAIPSVYYAPMVDQWRLTGTVTGDNDPIATNLARALKLGGDSMTNTNGIFTFPKTGIYKIEAVFAVNHAVTTGSCEAQIWATSNLSNATPTYSIIARGFESGLSSLPECSISMSALVDVTDVAEVAVKFAVDQGGDSNVLRGTSTYNETHFTFTRIGDT